MKFDEFTGEVQQRLELAETGEAVRATRATLQTLGQRIPEGGAADLAASLPMEVKWYPAGAVDEHGQRFDWDEFVSRVSDVENVDRSEAAYHAQLVVDLVRTQVSGSDFQDLRDQLPADEDWDELFGVVDAGGWEETRGSEGG